MMEEVEGQQKSMEKQRQQRKVANTPKPHPWLTDEGVREGEAEDTITR
jgi:hypothetical protein